MPERVVVTGIGVTSPLGPLPAFWSALCDGRSGIAPIAEDEPGKPRLEARVRDWRPRDTIAPALLRRMDRFSQTIVSASRAALTDAALTLDAATAESAGVVVGTAFGNLSESEEFLRGLFAKGPARANPLTFPNLVMNAPTGYVAIDLGIRGPNLTVVRGEASGEAALALAYDTIVAGQAELLIAGGGDELAPVLRAIYADLDLLSPGDGGGREWSSPFDRHRNGFVMGEGAAMLVLERADRAAARGARVYAELVGYATESLAASPHDWPTAAAATAANETARQLAALGFPRRDAHTGGATLVVSCANSTPRLDRVEAARLSALLGAAAPETLVTSIKGAVGEFGAAGALAAAAGVLALASGELPRLGSLEDADDVGLALARPGSPAPRGGFETVLISATPRGGGCVTLLFRKV